jgi:organic hydroperoxide reductase OsmC/OhrA
VRGIKLAAEELRSTAKGINELRDRIPVLTRIDVHYQLRIPPGSRSTVDRALTRHVDKCPTAQSLKGAVHVTWTAEIVEERAEG